MGLQVRLSSDGNEVTIDTPERFDFSVHTEFRKAYKDHSAPKKYVINLKNTKYMDSSALGMLLQLREHLGNDVSALRVSNADEFVKKILDIANFQKLMQVD